MATKAEVTAVKTDLRAEITEVKADLKAENAELRADIREIRNCFYKNVVDTGGKGDNKDVDGD